MIDLWCLYVGAILLFFATIFGAFQELEEKGVLESRSWAAWKNRLSLLGTGIVAAGSAASLYVNPDVSIPGAPWVFLILPFAAFILVSVVVWKKESWTTKSAKMVRITIWAAIVWMTPAALLEGSKK